MHTYRVHTCSGASFLLPANVLYKYIFCTFWPSSTLESTFSSPLNISTFSLCIFSASALQAPMVTSQDDIHSDRIVSYFPMSDRRAESPKGLSLISSFRSFLHPFNTYSIPLSLSPANAIDSISSCSAYTPM